MVEAWDKDNPRRSFWEATTISLRDSSGSLGTSSGFTLPQSAYCCAGGSHWDSRDICHGSRPTSKSASWPSLDGTNKNLVTLTGNSEADGLY